MKKEYRIKKNEEFQRIIKKGKSKAGKYFVIYSADALEVHDRIGISVGKRNGNAVVRNRIKRQVRMMLQEICDFSTGKDYIIIVRKHYNPSNYDNNKKDLSAVYNSVYNRQGQTFVKEN